MSIVGPPLAADARCRRPAPEGWQPRIVAFFCHWCAYSAADLAGVDRRSHCPDLRVIRVMCSGRVDPQFVLDAFAKGADGVLIGACHPGDCHYVDGNTKALRRFVLLQRTLEGLGIEQERLRLEWISASEAERVRAVADEMSARLRVLGPLSPVTMPEAPFSLAPDGPGPGEGGVVGAAAQECEDVHG